MIAIVEDDVAGVASPLISIDLVHQICRNFVGGRLAPIGGHRIPGDWNQAELACELKNIWTSRTKWRAEVAHRLADNIRESVVRSGEFLEYLGIRGSRKLWVGPGVIADKMACFEDTACEFALRFRKLSDHEKGGADIVLGQKFE